MKLGIPLRTSILRRLIKNSFGTFLYMTNNVTSLHATVGGKHKYVFEIENA